MNKVLTKEAGYRLRCYPFIIHNSLFVILYCLTIELGHGDKEWRMPEKFSALASRVFTTLTS